MRLFLLGNLRTIVCIDRPFGRQDAPLGPELFQREMNNVIDHANPDTNDH